MDAKAVTHCEQAMRLLIKARQRLHTSYGTPIDVQNVESLLFGALDELNKVIRLEELTEVDND